MQETVTLSSDEAAHKLTEIIVNSTREKEGGQFMHIDGTTLPW
jgi:hypothetical protein